MNQRTLMQRIIGAPLHWQILVAMVFGGLFGWLFKEYGPGPDGSVSPLLTWLIDRAKMLGDLFIRLLKMMIVPLVASSIVVGVSSAGDSKNLGRLGLKTFLYYICTSLIAICIGLGLSNIIRPGVGVTLPEGAQAYDTGKLSAVDSHWDILLRMVPTNPVEAMANMDMLGLIFFSIVLGITLTQMPKSIRDRLLQFFNDVFETMMKLTGAIIRFAPIGVFGLILVAVYSFNEDFFRSLGFYFLTLGLGLSIHLFVVLPTLFWIFTRRNPINQYKHMTNAMLTAFSTSSSAATLPVTMECVEEEAGVSNRISSFVLPLGATVNMDGTALYECAGVLFIAQVMGVPMDFSQQLIIVLTAFLASVGAAGIPSAGLVMIFIVLQAVGLDGPQVALIVGAMLAIDRPLDMYRTVVNIFSDSVGTVIIANSEGEIDVEKAAA